MKITNGISDRIDIHVKLRVWACLHKFVLRGEFAALYRPEEVLSKVENICLRLGSILNYEPN